jgi:hypothetical protein
MSRDTKYWHNKGEQDASRGRHKPPHQGPALSQNWWESDMNGRPVVDNDKQADWDAYQEGWDKGRDDQNNDD